MSGVKRGFRSAAVNGILKFKNFEYSTSDSLTALFKEGIWVQFNGSYNEFQ